MTSEELEQLKAYTNDITKKTGIKFFIDSSCSFVITFVNTKKKGSKHCFIELYGGRKLSAHKKAIDQFVKDYDDPYTANKREKKYYRGAPDFPAIGANV